LLAGLLGPLLLLEVLLLAFVIHSGIGVGVVVNVDLHGEQLEVLLLLDGVPQQYNDKPLVNVHLVDVVGQRVAVLLALLDHPGDVLPGIAIVLHGLDDFDNGIHVLDILLNVLGLELVDVLLLLQLFDSLILILFDLLVLFPGDLLELLVLFILSGLVFQKILIACIIERRVFPTGEFLVFYIFV
jgi:hypothetical protein